MQWWWMNLIQKSKEKMTVKKKFEILKSQMALILKFCQILPLFLFKLKFYKMQTFFLLYYNMINDDFLLLMNYFLEVMNLR